MKITPNEVIAAIAGGSALLGSAVTGLITFKVTKRQVEAAEAEGTRQRIHGSAERHLDRQHDLLLAREEREQARKEDTYFKIAGYIDGSLRWAHSHIQEL